MTVTLCVVCRLPSGGRLSKLCSPCARSYDRAIAKSVTTIAVIEWAAHRARRFALADGEGLSDSEKKALK